MPGDQVGFFALPPVGAKVWIEFEGGDTDYPIWTGCFWTDGQIPTGDAEPHIAFFKTDGVTIRVDGQSGSVDIETSGRRQDHHEQPGNQAGGAADQPVGQWRYRRPVGCRLRRHGRPP